MVFYGVGSRLGLGIVAGHVLIGFAVYHNMEIGSLSLPRAVGVGIAFLKKFTFGVFLGK